MVNNKIRGLVVLQFLILFQSCTNPCLEIRKSILPKEYYFKITKKDYYQYVILDGIDKKTKKSVQFKEGEYWGIYDSIQISDTLIKYKGSTDLILKKPNRQDTIVFEMYCDHHPMSDYPVQPDMQNK